ncbi:MAG: cation transporter [Clostridia bacterium]|nr:cation transporter [Clostridia bacterium]
MADTAYNNNYKKQQRVSFLNFLAELPNFVAVFVSAVLSGSLIVWMDFIDSLCKVADSGFVTLLSRKLKRDLKYEYNYGIGKIEAISSLCCEGILILGLFIIFASSAHELINPKPPSGLIVYVVLLKLINVAFDAFFLKEQYKIKKTVQARS